MGVRSQHLILKDFIYRKGRKTIKKFIFSLDITSMTFSNILFLANIQLQRLYKILLMPLRGFKIPITPLSPGNLAAELLIFCNR